MASDIGRWSTEEDKQSEGWDFSLDLNSRMFKSLLNLRCMFSAMLHQNLCCDKAVYKEAVVYFCGCTVAFLFNFCCSCLAVLLYGMLVCLVACWVHVQLLPAERIPCSVTGQVFCPHLSYASDWLTVRGSWGIIQIAICVHTYVHTYICTLAHAHILACRHTCILPYIHTNVGIITQSWYSTALDVVPQSIEF